MAEQRAKYRRRKRGEGATVSMVMDGDMIDRIDDLAEQREWSRGHLVRHAVTEWMKAAKKQNDQ